MAEDHVFRMRLPVIPTRSRGNNSESWHRVEATDFTGVFRHLAFAKNTCSGYNNAYFSRPFELRVARPGWGEIRNEETHFKTT